MTKWEAQESESMLELVASAVQVLTRSKEPLGRSRDVWAKLVPLTEPFKRTCSLATTSTNTTLPQHLITSYKKHGWHQAASRSSTRALPISSPLVDPENSACVRGLSDKPTSCYSGRQKNAKPSSKLLSPCDTQCLTRGPGRASRKKKSSRTRAVQGSCATNSANGNASKCTTHMTSIRVPSTKDANEAGTGHASMAEAVVRAVERAVQAACAKADEKAVCAQAKAHADNIRCRRSCRIACRAARKHKRSPSSKLCPDRQWKPTAIASAASRLPKDQTVTHLPRYNPTWQATSTSFSCNFPYRVPVGISREQALQEQKTVLTKPVAGQCPPEVRDSSPQGQRFHLKAEARSSSMTVKGCTVKLLVAPGTGLHQVKQEQSLAPFPMVGLERHFLITIFHHLC
jgi:hypothetical protein